MKNRRLLEVLFTPADFEALNGRDLSESVCIVFDVLRATSSMITALSNGAAGIVPVAGISEAVELHRGDSALVLAGEREGLRITKEQTGAIGFHLGNSPREFVSEAVRGKKIVMTTTNGTRALRACAHARKVFVSCFLNLSRTAEAVRTEGAREILVICSGTFEQTAYEDLLAAGALCELIVSGFHGEEVSDSALIALKAYQAAKADLGQALSEARNGGRLLSRPDLAADVAFCARRDADPVLAVLLKNEVVALA